MKKKSGKFLSLVLALVLCLGLIPTAARAADSDFIINTDGVLANYLGSGGDVVIPDGVTAISEWTFEFCDSLTSVTIPDGVTVIGTEAFAFCVSLTSVTIPASVTTIGVDAFHGCASLAGIEVAEENTAYCSVDGILFTKDMTTLVQCPGGKEGSVTIPDSVTTIGVDAFAYCDGLTSVTIPASVAYIGGSAFACCGSLTGITVAEGNTAYCSVDGMLFTKDMKTLVQCPGGKEGNVTIPDSVTTIGEEAFGSCASLTGVTIPDSVTTIGEEAFGSCASLTSVTIPASVTTIDGLAFYGCASLTIYGETGSYAQTYAKEHRTYVEQNEIPFVAMNAAPTAYQSTQSVLVDGQAVTFQCYALKDANGNLTNYIKLRDLADILNGSSAQFQVGWDGSVTITTKTAYTSNGSEGNTPFSGDRAYQESTAATKVNGQAAELDAFVLNDDTGGGYTYYQLRDLGKAIGFNVGWSAGKGIFVETNKPYDPAD